MSLRQLRRRVLGLALLLLPRPLRRRLYLRGMRFDPASVADLSFRPAGSEDEREQAFRLLHDCYVARGILAPRPDGRYMPAHAALPTTTLLVAVRAGVVVGTTSVIEDGELGLPLGASYGPELAARRATGRRLAEIGGLAIAPGERGKGIALMLYNLLYRLAHERLGTDELLIAVHPDIADFYLTILMFERKGGLGRVGELLDAPAVLLALDLADSRRLYFGAYDGPGRATAAFDVIDFFDGPQPPNLQLDPPAG